MICLVNWRKPTLATKTEVGGEYIPDISGTHRAFLCVSIGSFFNVMHLTAF